MRFEQGDIRGARLAFEAAFRIAPNPAVLFNIGQCFLSEGNVPAACSTFQRYLDESPSEIAKNRRPTLQMKCPNLR